METFRYRVGAREYDVYKLGHEGPPVILLHEMPGMSAESIRLGQMLAAEKFTVYMPLFFDAPGKARILRNGIVGAAGGHFSMFARAEASPAVEWVRGFGAELFARHGGTKVGVIGQCATGNFAVPLAKESWFGAGVLSQPAIPLFSKSATGLADADFASAEKATLLYFRFRDDTISTQARLDAFKHRLPALQETVLQHGCRPKPHAVLAEDYEETNPETVDAFRKVVATFRAKLIR